jgi:hypothetical protein
MVFFSARGKEVLYDGERKTCRDRTGFDREKVAEQHLADLHVEAKRLGEMLESLGRMLKERPEMVTFEREPVNVTYAARDSPLFKAAQIDGPTIVKLTTEIRDTMDKVEGLKRQARELGF